MSYTCTFLYVENGTSWVADGLAKEQLGVGAECLLYFFLAVVGIDEGAFYAEFLECHTKEVEGSTINLVGGNDMVACLADVEYSIEVGSLTATCQYSSHTAFELCYFLGYSIIGGILESGIEISFFLQVKSMAISSELSYLNVVL